MLLLVTGLRSNLAGATVQHAVYFTLAPQLSDHPMVASVLGGGLSFNTDFSSAVAEVIHDAKDVCSAVKVSQWALPDHQEFCACLDSLKGIVMLPSWQFDDIRPGIWRTKLCNSSHMELIVENAQAWIAGPPEWEYHEHNALVNVAHTELFSFTWLQYLPQAIYCVDRMCMIEGHLGMQWWVLALAMLSIGAGYAMLAHGIHFGFGRCLLCCILESVPVATVLLIVIFRDITNVIELNSAVLNNFHGKFGTWILLAAALLSTAIISLVGPWHGKKIVFCSMKFGTRDSPLVQATSLQKVLRPFGLLLKIIRNPAEIDTSVFAALRGADFFLAFGSSEYGKDTGNPASSAAEIRYWSGSRAARAKPPPILIRMQSFDREYKSAAADPLFNVQGNLQTPWFPNGPQDKEVPEDVIKHVLDQTKTTGHLPSCGSKSNSKCTCGRASVNSLLARASNAKAGGKGRWAKIGKVRRRAHARMMASKRTY